MKSAQTVLGALAAIALAAPALAADLPTRKGPPPAPYMAPQPVFTWTGAYIGAFAGGNWAHATPINTANAAVTNPALNSNGLTAGGLAGYNFGFGGFVIGGEMEAGYDHKSAAATNSGGVTVADMGNAEGRLRGRIGYAFGNSFLLFGAGGGTVEDLKLTASNAATSDEITHWRGGFNLGGGVEWAFSPHWIVRGEYIFDDFGARGYAFSQAGGGTFGTRTAKFEESTARAVLAYKF